MAEVPDRLCDDDLSTTHQPPANAYKKYFTGPSTEGASYFGMGVCNTAGVDVHVSVFLIPATESWTDGGVAPTYTAIVWKKLIEADATASEPWEMPNCVVRAGDRIAVLTDVVGVNFHGHGIRNTSV